MTDRTSITITADTLPDLQQAVADENDAMNARGMVLTSAHINQRDGKFCADLEFVEDGK